MPLSDSGWILENHRAAPGDDEAEADGPGHLAGAEFGGELPAHFFGGDQELAPPVG